MKGVDQKIYALAQGPVSVGGFSTGGADGGNITKNHPTVGRVSRGATVEKEIPVSLQNKDQLNIILINPDFTTAIRMRNTINDYLGLEVVRTIDPGTLEINIPETYQGRVVEMLAMVENLDITPDAIAKVVLNEKTGTIVIGENVRISTVAVAHGNLSILIKENVIVSQPEPFAPEPPIGQTTQQYEPKEGVVVAPGGQTVVSSDSDVTVNEEKNRIILLPTGSTIGELVRALNAIGVTPRDLITIFQAIEAAGALHAKIQLI
jgi:flagellar P-ring protein precursor FlgI